MGVLNGRNIVITGGSLGIGFETAKKCAAAGATVVISARDKNNLQNALTELKSISEKNHQCYSLDVSRYRDVKSFAE